jgi:cell division protein ZapA|tara:strand:+ start:349 stop:795 length:447 start_codon:yes stop_codon:yes gene_type:complete
MANVNIKFNGKEFLLSCENGQEEHLEELSLHLNEKFNDLKNSMGNIGENKLLLITSITVMDEYFETKKKIEQQKTEINKITEKFREIKSLVYEYKNDKEKEISNLSENQSKLINELEDHKINYESLVDRATSEIENFIKKHDTDIQVQ